MLLLAVRNLFQSRTRLLMSSGGLALALLLILSLDAIVTGAESQITAYVDHAGADVWVSQPGVRNLHMATSTLPASTVSRVAAVDGVASVIPIQYMTSAVTTGHGQHIAYVIGLPPDPASGGPWRMYRGAALPTHGEVVIDRTVADAAGLRIGDGVTILHDRFRVVGMAEGTASIVNSIAFITFADFVSLGRGADSASFLLVRVSGSAAPETVAARIEREVGGVTAQSRTAFAAQERRVVADMTTDLVDIMNLIGLLIGLAVMALTVYTTTLSRRAEYGVLKALGARGRDLYRVVIGQSLIGLVLGLVTSLTLVLLLAVVVPLVRPTLELEVTAASVAKVSVMAIAIAALSAGLPVAQVARLDPAAVFRRKV